MPAIFNTDNQSVKHSGPAARPFRRAALLLFLSGCLMSGSGMAQAKSFIQQYRPLADSLSVEYGVPASVILGVAIVESGSGTSRNCKLLNNFFGIVGKNNLLKTKGIKSRYKQYPDAAASFADFCKLQSRKKYYSKLKGNMDYKVWVEAISKSGYSEAPATWKQRVSDTIKKNKLSATR